MKTNWQERFRRLLSGDAVASMGLFALVFATYTATMCRTIYSGDDGDFITASATAGVPHPTGYPLFVLLGRLFLQILPLGTPALRMNLMTALFGTLAVVLFFRFAALLVPERFWAAAAALILAFASTFWQQSLSCEVYSLTCLFLTTILYLATLWQEQPDNDRLLLRLGFLYGLACTNHLTIVLFLPAFLLFVLARRPTLLRQGRLFGLLVIVFLVPLCLYAYLPIAARGNPPVNWGDPSTLTTFWDHITGRQYRYLMFSNADVVVTKLLEYRAHLFGEFGWWFLWLVPIGIVALWRRNRSLCAVLVYIWIVNVVYALNYHILDIYVYYLPSYIVTAAFLAAGASALNRWVYDQLRLTPERRAHYAPLVAVVAMAIPMLQYAPHYVRVDKSDNYLEQDFGDNLLRSAPPGALLVTNGQWCLPLWYRRFVLHQRTDVVPVGRSFLGGFPFGNAWYYRHVERMYPDISRTYPPTVGAYARRFPRKFAERLKNEDLLLDMMARAVRRGVPVLVAFRPEEDRYFMRRVSERFDAVPWGLGERVFLKGQAPPSGAVVRVNERLWAGFQTRGLYTGRARIDPMQAFIPTRYALILFRLGQHAEIAHRWDLAADAYARSYALNERPEAHAAMERANALAQEERRAATRK